MHDNWLIFTSLSVTGLGIVGLMSCLFFLEAPETRVDSVKEVADGSSVQVKGFVKGISVRGNVTIITVGQESYLDVVVFGENIELDEGDCISVRGKKSEYNSKEQLVANRIIECSATS